MEDLKLEGNTLFKSNNYEEALEKYKAAIELVDNEDKKNLSVLHSNMSATYCKLEQYNEALEYAVQATKLEPEWHKAWYRLSYCLHKLDKNEQAEKSIGKTIELCEKSGVTEKYIIDLKNKITLKLNKEEDEVNYNILDEKDNMSGMPNMPGMPNMQGMPNMPGMEGMMASMLNNPNIKSKLDNKEFQEKILKNQSNPFAMLGDPDMKDIMSEMMKNMMMGNK